MGSMLIFRAINKDGGEDVNRIAEVTADEAWVSFANVETKEQSMHWTNTHSLNNPKMFKQTFDRKLMATVFSDREGVSILYSC
jgi:hypothetical protein